MLDFMLLGYGADADETPSGTDSPADRHALSLLGADRPFELHLHHTAFPSAGYNAYGCGRADVEHQGLAGVDGLDTGFVRDSDHTLQELHIHGKSRSGGRKFARLACHLTYQGIALGHDGVEKSAYTRQASGCDLIQDLFSGQESYHFGLNGDPLLSALVFHEPARTDLNLVARMQDALA